ncbi:MAG: branched-chain amino acid ABC transporter permease [Lachnospiraceae bacterium]|nr:branched-chain amino acid ABC transporter permease [Lachnospiraceae bacterium]MBF1029216.1 branched-chain amino acid ABC transporter permease [Lachnospiraceae bacterium]
MNAYVESVVILICINAIAVLGMSVLTGFTRLFSFGNAGFMAIGAYTTAILVVEYHLPWVVAVATGAVLAGTMAFALGSVTLRLHGDYFLITCLGFGECVRVLFNYVKFTGGAQGYAGIPGFTKLPVAIISLILAFFTAWRVIHSKYGENFTTIRENEMAGEAVGVDTFGMKRMSFVLSAVYAGWAGGLYAGYIQYLSPSSFALAKSCELITTVVIGGLGSLTGSVLGTIVCTLLPEIFRSLSGYRMLVYGIAVVLVILLKPSGLYGYKEFSIQRIVSFITKGADKKGAAS